MYTVQCIQQLVRQCHVQTKDLQNLKVCIKCTIEQPVQLELGMPSEEVVQRVQVDPALVATRDSMESIETALKGFS